MRRSKRTISRDRDILALWRERPREQRRKMDVISLYAYIRDNQPGLFKGISGDQYQYLMGLLHTYLEPDDKQPDDKQ
jgi:hypothetical protein